eukprot:1185598-Prorocentrum_minimum.AAC.6
MWEPITVGKRGYSQCGSQSQWGREDIPNVGANHSGEERIFQECVRFRALQRATSHAGSLANPLPSVRRSIACVRGTCLVACSAARIRIRLTASSLRISPVTPNSPPLSANSPPLTANSPPLTANSPPLTANRKVGTVEGRHEGPPRFENVPSEPEISRVFFPLT